VSERQEVAPRLRIVWTLVLVSHVVLAGVALRLLPHGFPLAHPRTVLGLVVPCCLIAGSVVISAFLWLVPRIGAAWLSAIPAFWVSVVLSTVVIFPQTGWAAARPLGALAVTLGVLALLTVRRHLASSQLPAALVGTGLGVLSVYCQRPVPASTQPWPSVTSPVGAKEAARAGSMPVAEESTLVGDVVVVTATPELTWRGSRAAVTLAPTLTFDRTSPDGFWSLYAPVAAPRPPITSAVIGHDELKLWDADGALRLQVRREGSVGPGQPTRALHVDTSAVLAEPVYSHLNSFTTVTVSGHRRLGLRFSPCPSEVIAFTHADYPTGAPARFAYVDAARRFRVVEATDAEKGPFTTLAEGNLSRDAILEIELLELEDEPVGAFARLELQDFASLLSTALSPTAGYGVAENAIQFGLASPDPASPAHLLLTLAATGVGRGWDSVGHAAGTYPNRIVLRSLETPAPAASTLPHHDASFHDESKACVDIARDIIALKPKYAQLSEFDETRVMTRPGECTINYAYHTHRSTLRGGWVAQVPNPAPDGLWFHVGVWDPQGPGRQAQINTQPGGAVFSFGDDNVTVLVLDGAKTGSFHSALVRLLSKHGMGALR
jgi:hypothetical protein